MPSAESTERPRERTRRLFLALWPDEANQLKMDRATREALRSLDSPRAVPAHNLHVTLVFIGAVEEGRLASLRSIAERVSREACAAAEPGQSGDAQRTRAVELIFERIEYWEKAKVLCALTDEASRASQAAPAAVLADRLRGCLLDDGFAPDLKPFRPHVTLARKVVLKREAPGAASPDQPAGTSQSGRASDFSMAPVIWRFTQFALIDSRTEPGGSLYSVLARWPLCTESTQMSGKNLQ